MRFRYIFIFLGSLAVLFALFATDPDRGITTGMLLLSLVTPLLAVLFAHLGRKALPEVLLFYDRIFRAFAANITLYGSVAQCILDPDGPSIEGPMEMRWGSEDFHFGMIAHWTVKEILTGVTVS